MRRFATAPSIRRLTRANSKPAKKNKRGPRAIAVVEFLPGGGTRLVPIALWIDGHFYDASLYGANPEPMALEPETLYQALNVRRARGLVYGDNTSRRERKLGCRRAMETRDAGRSQNGPAGREAAQT